MSPVAGLLAVVALAGPEKCDPARMTPAQVDSFCSIYTKVVVAVGEGKITATPSVKRRILANEVTYNALCKPAAA